ncbi:MAG: hypothetical protein HFK08_02145 [Clostridia bacterium]|nr:hypothetical protein [Clostridia bacterium]
MLTAFSIIILVLTFVSLPFVFTVNLKADLFENSGTIAVSLFFVPIFKARIRVESESATEKNIVVISGKKRDEIHLNADKNDKKSVMALFKAAPVMSYLTVEKLDVEAAVGFAANAFSTTMIVGVLRTFFGALSAFLKSRQNIAIRNVIVPSYNKNKLDFDVEGIFKLSLANIINGFIAGILNKLEIKAKRNGKMKTRALKVRL